MQLLYAHHVHAPNHRVLSAINFLHFLHILVAQYGAFYLLRTRADTCLMSAKKWNLSKFSLIFSHATGRAIVIVKIGQR